ncbi:MAG: Rrf2 family transcriptional regulator [Spirochaetota bacterium]|nr:MAG: Rrf2 family transcriptional regulator [Spirochaetota bacterium]
MLISTRTRYGLRAILDLALHYSGKPVFLKDIALREGISRRYLENIFTKLRTAGILKSSKGRGGGFCLARDPAHINLLDIIEVLENNLAFSSCTEDPSSCERQEKCISREAWVSINESFKNSLDSITIADLIKNHARKNLVSV